ncbi:MAG: DUF5009 domain-containing protein [Candidatus Sumerlaeia bacterium]
MTASTVPLMPVPVPRRALGLDALRGIAILLMVLSGIEPPGLPAWMHHAQVPPPDFQFNPNLPGLTWVDLVFPFFLFALGAAVPLALARRMEKGVGRWRLALGCLERGVLLGFFAVYRNHFVNPWALSVEPGRGDYLLCIVAFVLLFAMYWRFPSRWPAGLCWGVRLGGWAAALGLMAALTFAHGHHADPRLSSDIIIIILANVAVSAGVVWLLTAARPVWRLGVLPLLFAVNLSAGEQSPSWIKTFWTWQPVLPWPGAPEGFGLSWLFGFGFQNYLHIVIPGTLAGDLILRWMRAGRDEQGAAGGWGAGRLWGLLGLAVVLCVTVCAGLQGRHLSGASLAAAALTAAGLVLVRSPRGSSERLLHELCLWAAFWLALGLLFEPYQGGIKKDPPTMSYFYVTAGLATFLLAGLMGVIDMLGRLRPFQLLVDNGQNPMIAYVGHGMFLLPLMLLIPVPAFLRPEGGTGSLLDWVRYIDYAGPWWGFGRACVEMLVLALIVSAFTRRGVFWRT